MSRSGIDGPVREFLHRQAKSGAFSGASWSVGNREGAISEGAVGVTATGSRGESVRPDTLFDLASLTKPLATALPAAILEERGLLDLEAPIVEFLPAAGRTDYADATLLDLGTHSAGLPAWKPLWAGERTLESYVTRILSFPPANRRGEVLYSDLGFILLGAVLEEVAGKKLDRLFLDEIAEPLDLTGIGFPGVAGSGDRPAGIDKKRLDSAAATEVGNRYERDLAGEAGRKAELRDGLIQGEVHDGNAWAVGGVTGHAGLFGSAPDSAAICRELLAPGGGIFGEGPVDRLLKPRIGGRSFGLRTAPDCSSPAGVLPEPALGHTGFTGTAFWIDPGSSRYWVLLTNRVHPKVEATGFQEVRRQFLRRAVGEYTES